MQAINLKIKGIKCDNPICGFKDDTVEYQDYEAWRNKPCPLCGTNLLTDEDMAALEALVEITCSTNTIFKPCENANSISVAVEMNGTGKIKFIARP